MRVWDTETTLRLAVEGDPRIAGRLSPAALDACFDVRAQLRNVPRIFNRTLTRRDW
jgi:hypothetical protein